jgi:hypothetical protein
MFNGIMLPSADFITRTKPSVARGYQKMLHYLGSARQQIYYWRRRDLQRSVFALKFMLNYPKVKLYNEWKSAGCAIKELPY